MKKSLLGLITLLFGFQIANAQTAAYTENFEAPSNGDSVVSSGPNVWHLDNFVPYEGTQYYLDSIPVNDTVTLTSIPFSTVGQNFVTLSFAHFCKIEFFDRAFVEYSDDGGTTWTKLGGSQYLGASTVFNNSGNDSSFNSFTYGQLWEPSNQTATPQQSWWRVESFDVSSVLGNLPNAMFRFRMLDGNLTGANGNYGWAIDSIYVEVAPCELIPPTITGLNGPTGAIYGGGPYGISANLSDASGIDSAYVIYTVNAGIPDTVMMTNQGGGNYQGIIPAATVGDSICYKVVGVDASPCSNKSVNPPTGDVCFVYRGAEELPYFNDFENSPDFVAGPPTGSSVWQHGTPAFGLTNMAFSGTKAWDVNLGSPYGASAQTVLTSPPFNFTNAIGPTLSFQINYRMESGWDGMYVEYSTDSITWNLLGSVGDPDAVNWYNDDIDFGFSDAFTGSSNGFKEASIRFNHLNGEQTVFFRFVFHSDNFGQQDGVTIDDFKITLPEPYDIKLVEILNPGGSTITGTDSAEFRVENFGTEIIDTFTVNFEVNGGGVLSHTYYDTILPATFLDLKVDTFSILAGANTICAWVSTPRDSNFTNDTICKPVNGVPGYDLPFFSDFDTGSIFTVTNPGGASVWELGNPTFPAGHSAFSPPNSWDVDLAAGYLANSETYLHTPWFKMSGVVDPIMSFQIYYDSESFWDGVHVEYTTDGATWNVLGVVNDPNGTNWYNFTNLNSSGTPGWAGNSNGWIPVELNMPFLTNTAAVRFRFAFTSDGSVQQRGASIDNFSLRPKPDYDITLMDVLSPVPQPCGMGTNELLTVRFRNSGVFPVTDIPMSFFHPSIGLNQDTAYQTVNPGDTVSFTFTQTLDVSDGGTDYILQIYAHEELDSVYLNDTIPFRVVNPAMLAPETQDFEAFTLGTPGANSEGWSQSQVDQMDWSIHSGGTTSGSTGPTGDHTTGSGIYIYTETSGSGSNKTAIYNSPCADLSNNTSMKASFWYHMYGATMGELNFEVRDALNVWHTVWSLSGDQGNDWHNAVVDISAYTGQEVQFRFRAETGTSFTSDMAVDDFFIFEPQPYDAAIVSIVNPVLQPACGYSAFEPITVEVNNFGINPLDTIPIAYSLNGGPMIWDTVYGPINAPDTVLFTFAQTADMSTPGATYNLLIHTQHPRDTNYTVNDTIVLNDIINQTKSAPYFTDFDTFPLGFPTTLLEGWRQDLDDDRDWSVNTGGTTSFGTGPSADHTQGPGGSGRYLYIESGFATGDTAILLSPCFDLEQVVCPKVEFWYNMNGNQMGSLALEISDTTGNWTEVWYEEGDKGDVWTKASINVVEFTGQRVKFRFKGGIGGNNSDMAIDDFEVIDAPPLDLGLERLVSPFGAAAIGAEINPIVEFRNLGCDSIYSVDVSYAINGGTPIVETYTGLIEPDELVRYTFTSIYTIPANNFNICAEVSVAGDMDPTNDQICGLVKAVPGVPITHCSDFDQGPGGWLPDSTANNPWAHGVPNGNIIQGANSQPNAWMTGLGPSPHPNNLESKLYSPYYDFRGAPDPVFSMYLWLNSEEGDDGLRVDYTLDGGESWSILGPNVTTPHPDAIGWYNDASVNASGLPGWTGNSFAWLYVEHPLDFLAGHYGVVQFRLVYESDFGGANGDGAAVDDICITTPPLLSGATVDLVTQGSGLTFPGTNLVQAKVKNSGFTPINSIVVNLNIDNGAFTVSDTVTLPSPLVFGSHYLHTFSVPWNATEGDHPACANVRRPNNGIDIAPLDDSICTVFQVIDTAQAKNYCNDFEGSKFRWVTKNAVDQRDYGTHWELGSPAQVHLDGARSGSNAWMTRLDEDYGQRDSSALFTPLFTIDTNKCYEFSFYHKWATEFANDGGTVHYSQDEGATWNIFGYAFEPQWFVSNWVVGIPGFPYNPGWTGQSPATWVQGRHLIQFEDPAPVIFRFRFGSDMTVFDEGWAIDDFCFREFSGVCYIGLEEELEFGISQAIPNPTSTSTRFDLSLAKDEDVVVEIYNAMGQVVRAYDLSLNRGESSHIVEVNDLSDGLYYISFQLTDGTVVNRNFSVSK